VEWKSE
jgi:hypothetical protein